VAFFVIRWIAFPSPPFGLQFLCHVLFSKKLSFPNFHISLANLTYQGGASSPNVFGSGGAGRLRLMGNYIGHRLVARPEPDNTFLTASTVETESLSSAP